MTTQTKTDIQTKIDAVTQSTYSEDLRVTESVKVGDVIMQGDVNLHVVAADHPRGKPLGTRQVAVGEGVGSHHVAQGDVEVYEGARMPSWYREPFSGAATQQLGPVIVPNVKSQDGSFTLAHPVHADHRLPMVDAAGDACAYQVTYPVDAHTQRRVQD